jgi:uncharacterized protein GlcG (DUF336 family)
MIQVPKLTRDDAAMILAGARQEAEKMGVPMDIAVVDDGGHLLAFERMDGAKITSIQVAIDKAYTAAGTRKGTHEYSQIAGAGGPAFGIFVSNQGRFMIFGGGLPIFSEGVCVGAIGCSSGSVEQDKAVAQAGIDALNH